MGNGWTGVNWRVVALPALPEPDGKPLRVGVGEQWCGSCGEVIGPWMEIEPGKGRVVRCCREPRPLRVEGVLLAEEFYEAR